MLNRWASSGAPTLALDFISGAALDSRITFTRASSATRFNASGVMETVGNNVHRIDYNPSTLAVLGLLIEGQRTNVMRNNTMVGAVAGSPGTVPTNWAIPASADGLSREIVAVGVENGVEFIDIRYSGTLAAGGAGIAIAVDANNNAAASNGQTWTASMFWKLVAGSFNGINTAALSIRSFDATPALLENLQPYDLKANSTGTLTRVTGTSTLSNAATAFVNTGVRLLTGTAGAAVDLTLRIGLPQLELGAFATSTIKTTGAQTTRAADVATMSLAGWFNATEGTLVGEADVSIAAAYSGGVMDINDSTSNNRHTLFRQSDSQPVTQTVVAGAAVASFGFGATWNNTAAHKLALAYRTNDFAGCADGGTVATDTVGTLPTVTQLRIGSIAGGSMLNGHVRKLSYYPRRLSGPQLQALTA